MVRSNRQPQDATDDALAALSAAEAVPLLRLLIAASSDLDLADSVSTTIERFLHLVVPTLADYCTIAASATHPPQIWHDHRDPQQLLLLQELESTCPLGSAANPILERVRDTEVPEIGPAPASLPPNPATAAAIHEYELVCALQNRCYMALPLVVHKRPFGVVLLVITGADHTYRAADLVVAQALVERLAHAIEHRQVHEQRHEVIQERGELAARLNTLIQTAPIGLGFFDRDLRYQLINKHLAELNGFSIEEHLGRTVAEIVPKLAPTAVAAMQHVLATGEPVTDLEIVSQRLTHNGERRVWSVSYYPVHDQQTEILGVGAMVVELTERKQTLAELRIFRSAVDNAMSAIVIAEMDGTITYVNQAFLQLWGNDPEQVIGRSVMLFWGEPEQVADLMAATPREGKWMGELVARQRDQSPRVIEVLASVVTDMVGRPIRIMSSFIDITERKQNEAARHAQSQELARINEELVRAARLQDEFLASMSHELRTPLTVILGNAEMLYENMHGMLTERQLRLVQTIEESGQRLLGLINNILDLSKALAHKITLSLGPVVVASFGQICLRKIADAAYQKKQTVHLSLDQAVQVIQADEPRLLQILLHLLSNAVKFTPEAGELGLEVHGDLGAHEVHLTVWDTGIGIAPDDQARLFQPFVQIDSRLSREYEGTGLGLALAASLAELHHGRITMMSVLGQGSRFTLILPWEPELRPTQRSRRTSP